MSPHTICSHRISFRTFFVATLAGPVLATPNHYVGVNAHQPSEDVLDAAKDLNVSWIRIDLNWFQAEPARDSYDWTLFDAIIDGDLGEMIGALKLDAFLPEAEVKRARGWEVVPGE